ncbi:MAG: glycine--tRNA ligase [Firmicutes bacterium]|nr:glycine--tRNA ligase [Bacillota bacterium]
MEQANLFQEIVSLCKRRAVVFPSSEIYGGINSCWDYGPLGVELRRNLKDLWWKAVVQGHRNVVGADTSIIMHPEVWVASGHRDHFTDPLVDCKSCKQRFRADQIDLTKCPECGGQLTEPRSFNLMFKTYMGPVEDDAAQVFLRPETAQGIFVDFETIFNGSRGKLPFGIAQIGKSFRNEVSPGNFIFRSREFEQMELEFFVDPSTEDFWFDKWVKERLEWYVSIGINPERLRTRPHGPDELAHYAKACVDIEYLFPFGWKEIEGIANRGQFDLQVHARSSGKQLVVFDQVREENVVPSVIESSSGVDRILLVALVDAYEKEAERSVLRFHPTLAPTKVAVLPLMRKEPLVEKAVSLEEELRGSFTVEYDDAGSIGRRYRRQDESGTPYCLTVDYQSLEDDTVTIRFRDSMRQERLPVKGLTGRISELMKSREPMPVE